MDPTRSRTVTLDLTQVKTRFENLLKNMKQVQSENQNLKSEMKAKEELLENLENSAGKLYAEKDFADLKIVCNEKTLVFHKAVLTCQSKVFNAMIRNKSLIEKQDEVMEIK